MEDRLAKLLLEENILAKIQNLRDRVSLLEKLGIRTTLLTSSSQNPDECRFCETLDVLPGHEINPVNPDNFQDILIHDTAGAGLILTGDFEAATPTWFLSFDGLTLEQSQLVNKGLICPNGSVYVCFLKGGITAVDSFIARAPNIGGTFEIVEDQASINAKMGTTGHDAFAFQIACNPLVPEQVVYVLAANTTAFKTYIGADDTPTAGATGTCAHDGSSLSFGAGGWLYTCKDGSPFPAGRYYLFSADMSTLDAQGDLSVASLSQHVRPGTSGLTVHFADTADAIGISEDNCATFTGGISPSVLQENLELLHDPMAISQDGLQIMTRSAATGHCKSDDQGENWTDIDSLPAGSFWYFMFLGGSGASSRWIAVGDAYVKYSADFGVTWEDKEGNLATIAPAATLNVIKGFAT